MNDKIVRAERDSRSRALIMAAAALIILLNGAIQFGNHAYSDANARGAAWIVLVLLWMIVLASGGALFAGRDRRRLINDELSLLNRASAVATGFYAAMLSAVAVYAGDWFRPISVQDAIRMITAVALAAALSRYAWLELR